MDKVKTEKSLRHAEYYGMVKVFDNLYAQSQNNRIFENLMDLVLSDENILLAYRNIKKNSGSKTSGTDKINIEHLKEYEESEFLSIIKSMLKQYEPKPVKRVDIPKSNGKTRPLGIPTIWDRIIQQCLLQILEPICEAKFYDRNYGFRPNRSAHHALAQAARLMQVGKMSFVVDIDIKGFFDNVNHAKLIRQMWTLGIRDKWLLGVIRAMLKAPVIHKDGTVEHPKKGTPQGGVLSPLLANIVLNELDWWIASQWENIQTRHEYCFYRKRTGQFDKSNKFRALRTTKLKEIYLVRYADDFKLFCKKRSDADKAFHATKLWLKERLKLDVSNEKSKVVNLKKNSSEFLGFELKLVRKRKTFVVESHMSKKSIKNVSNKLANQIKKVQHSRNADEEIHQLALYNSMVIGIHHYYKKATHISVDCPNINQRIRKMIYIRLKPKNTGPLPNNFVKKYYAKSKQLKWINNYPILPIGYVKHSYTSLPKTGTCKYTEEGRELIHKYLEFPVDILNRLMRKQDINESVEFMDNRLSKYSSQRGKCAVTKNFLEYEEIYCHRITPKILGGKENYQNLVIIHQKIHNLIHEIDDEIISQIISEFKLNDEQITKVNNYRRKANNSEIMLNLDAYDNLL